MKGLFNVQHPFFIPLWRRVAITAITLIWAVVELSNGQPIWACIFGAAGLYLAYQFFVVFDPDQNEKDET